VWRLRLHAPLDANMWLSLHPTVVVADGYARVALPVRDAYRRLSAHRARGGVSRAAQSHRVTWRAMTVAKRDIAMLLVAATLTACGAAPDPSADAAARDERLARIHASYVFADIHAHPSRFHRANVDRIDADEMRRCGRVPT